MHLNEELISLAGEIIAASKIFGLTLKLVPPTDDRVSCQIEIFDMPTGKTYAIQANTREDVTSLLPRLLKSLLAARE
jgi:hypothetical protein